MAEETANQGAYLGEHGQFAPWSASCCSCTPSRRYRQGQSHGNTLRPVPRVAIGDYVTATLLVLAFVIVLVVNWPWLRHQLVEARNSNNDPDPASVAPTTIADSVPTVSRPARRNPTNPRYTATVGAGIVNPDGSLRQCSTDRFTPGARSATFRCR